MVGRVKKTPRGGWCPSLEAPYIFYWVGVGKRSTASFVALDALFQMGIGPFPAVAAPEPKICPERVQQIADFLPNPGPSGILGQNPPKILV